MLTWKEQNTRFGSPSYMLISHRIPVGAAGYNLNRSKGDGPENSYRWNLSVPGNERKGFSATIESAKQAAEVAFAEWCKAAGLALVP